MISMLTVSLVVLCVVGLGGRPRETGGVLVGVSCEEWRVWCFCFVAPQGWQRWVHCGIVIVSLCGATLAHSCGGAGPCFHRRLWVLPTLTDAVWNAWRGVANTSRGVHKYPKEY